MTDKFLYKKFEDIDLNDNFFDSLKKDYHGFEKWFKKKAEEYAYVQTINNKIEGFLYLKIEEGYIEDVNPVIACERAVKVGTMKINPHGTRLGERFIKKSLDFAIKNNISYIYVTVFEKHDSLIKLYEKYGFYKHGIKTTGYGSELVYVKNLNYISDDFMLNYPKINKNSNVYLLSIMPKYHTRLFPDSILTTESFDIVKDISHTNSIEKIYICRMNGVEFLQKGDLLVIYRTSHGEGIAEYKSVATSLCVVEDVKQNSNFNTFEDYKEYCKNYSVFSENELFDLYNARYNYTTIKMSYNIALSKRITRHDLIEKVGISRTAYPGFMKLKNKDLDKILELGSVNNGYIIE
ncbi:GNAT family N-acetyltransferase [Intestinibacter bartlettii]|uniref:GNAT family N-acetyltransferase n=1 Tax=Intestinibacter bartlettii TaxID=261299 RepID=UPI0008207922|nr:GNAT family N-acetyltransferase [Intestinibacter bartlettii]SCI46539.1 Uncharacterised protein [uncultured Clostridium sp.]